MFSLREKNYRDTYFSQETVETNVEAEKNKLLLFVFLPSRGKEGPGLIIFGGGWRVWGGGGESIT